jgi:lysophospholipase L1-like esterase
MYDLAHYADRVIFPYRPRAILIYEGDNDISAGIPPAVVLRTFTELVERIHRRFPDTRVYVLAVKPSPSRWKCWEGMRELNALLLGACEKDSLLHFVDVATPMLDDKGEPRPELYIGDRLHLSADGYALWTRVVREVLLEKELPHEKREP